MKILAAMPALLLALVLLSSGIGASHVPVSALGSDNHALAELARQVVVDIRLPRTVLAILTGASLGLAGAVLQGLLRNPLADPGIMGISSTAALGAVIAFYFGFQLIVAGGIAGSLVAVLILVGLAGRQAGTLTLLLAGVALSSLAVALTSLALNLAPSPLAAYEILFWLLGSVADRSWHHVYSALPLILAGWAVLATTGKGLDALALGEEVAHSLGINLVRLRWSAVIGTALAVGAAVSVTGSIGFIGLMVPHLMRPLVGHRSARLLPACALAGAILLLAADIVIRLLSLTAELKLGVATALLGAPFFLIKVLRMRERE
ncbi:MAG TPA: iron ABC transporter permease [Magnetospirillaceae bacterium]|nr:iron ABC transporter permease [Magnetospirillaceae bacterium]